MLNSLHVKNIALIDEVEIDFSEGLNILTGETGAGKSILIDSVNFALGARMPKDIARNDSENALCELVFSIEDDETLKALSDLDIDIEDGEVILTRKLSAGKSSIKCNGETITAAMARQIASYLIDIHGQHEHQSLLYKENHRKILDEYCGDDFLKCKADFRDKYREYKRLKAEYEEAVTSSNTRDADADYCRFVVNEIEAADLKPGEDAALEEQYSKMNNSRRIAEAVSGVRELLSDDEAGASSNISRAVSFMKQAMALDGAAEDLYSQIIDAEGILQDFLRNLSDYEEGLVFSPEEFAACEERLNEINRLKMKYAPTIEGILQHHKEQSLKLEKIGDYDGYVAGLKADMDNYLNEVMSTCDRLSKIRKCEAEKLSESIKAALLDLNFLNAEFEINILSGKEHLSEEGYDDVEFMISTNPGEKIKPLTSVASGGELSRIMLALKSVFAGKDNIGTLIFDEIDTGISGRTANLVADKMTLIAQNHQVICVTHLPQIASHAQNHLLIEKKAEMGRTVTGVYSLDYEGSVREIARMLAGAEITETTIASAREMKMGR